MAAETTISGETQTAVTTVTGTTAATTPDAGTRAMLSGLRQRIGVGVSLETSPATPKRESNRELLDRAMNAATDRERNRAAETLRRQIKSLCAAVVDRHTSALTSQEVEDLTQEVFLRLLTSQAGNVGEAVVDPTPAYIARVAVNLLIDRRRSLKRRGLDQLPASVEDEAMAATLRDPSPSVEETVLGRLRTRDLRRALLKSLSPTEAKVIWMRTEGASHEEIAQELNIKEPNARKHCERGMKRLKTLVETNAIPLLG
ncbi:MAG: RNA polymerase sigma factor [Cytophagales bacterium]|nr:RNA polymerase sigma factor [Armatimonadota bacterium]